MSRALAAATIDVQPWRRYHEQAELALLDDGTDASITRKNAARASVAGVSTMTEANAPRTPKSFPNDATGEGEAVNLRMLNQRRRESGSCLPGWALWLQASNPRQFQAARYSAT